MSIEIDDNQKEDAQVHMFFSPVVESIIILCALLLKNKREFPYLNLAPIEKELNITAKATIGKWREFVTPDIIFCLELFITIPQFQNGKTFCAGIAAMEPDEFAQKFLGGEIPKELLDTLISSPEKIYSIEQRYEWDTPEKQHYILTLLSDINTFQRNFIEVLQHIQELNSFKEYLEEAKSAATKSLAELDAMNIKPLALAQYVMGKTFRRTSNYKHYYFIPSYGFTPVKMRIFNDTHCMVIYGCGKPLSDDRKKSEDLSKQLKVLADPNRLLILKMLRSNKEYGARLAEYVGLTTATVSHHLDVLKKAKLIKEEKIGTIKYFYTDSQQVENMIESLQQFAGTRSK